MTNQTNIHYFGDLGESLRAFTGRDGMTVSYDAYTYTQLMALDDVSFCEARHDEIRYTGRKAVRAAYAVAAAARSIRSWRAK